MTREQNRANFVYKRIEKYKNDETLRKDYGSMAHRFPALLRNAGLVQALAFVKSRSNKAHKKFIYDLTSVLYELEGVQKSGEEAFDEYFKQARKAELPQYMRLTREALAVSDWFKRFAQSVLKVEPGGD